MSKNINQVFIANPITSNTSTDLMYFGQSPYGVNNDAAMTYTNFAAQFGAPYTAAALTKADDTNVTITLGGTPATALLHATSITMGWTGVLSSARGGTGVNNGTSTFTIGGNFQMSGAFTFNGTLTGNTAVTFPTSGTLATTSQLPTPAALTKSDDTNITVSLGGSPSTALLQATSITMGWTGTLSGTRGGTGVNNGSSTITLGGSLTTSGAFASTFTMTATTSVTFPTSGTLATTSQLPTPAALTKTDDTNVTLTLGGTPATALLQATSLTLGWTGLLSLARGGTNANLTASNGGIFYSTASAGAILAGTSTANQIVLSGSNAAPSWSTATYPATTTVNQILFSSSANTITGLTTGNSSTIFTNTSGVPAWTGSMTNGQLLIGSTSASPALGTLTAGTGVTITNGAASITVASSGADPWVDQTTATVTMAVNTGYTSDAGASLITFTLPATSAIGDWIEINGKAAGGWKIAQAAGQQIKVSPSATTSGVGGSLASANQLDCVTLRCITANTIWTVVSQQSAGLTVV